MSQEDGAPPALRCAASHALLREPARAADGFTYERAVAADWLLAAGTRAHAHTNTRTHAPTARAIACITYEHADTNDTLRVY